VAKYISQRAIQRQRRKFWKRIVLSVLLIGLLMFSLSWFFGLEKINIKNITVVGNSVVRTEDVIKQVERKIFGKYFKLFAKSNFLIYPKKKIKEDLLSSFSQIKELDIQFKFKNFQSIIIKIEERKPYAIWCDSLMDEKCYFMDEEAYLYDKAPDFSKDIYLKFIGDLQGVSTTTPITQILRQTFLSSMGISYFEKLNLFIRLLKDININGYRLVVEDNGDYKLFFNNESKLIFDDNQDFEEIFGNLQATLIELGDLGDQEFDYIDLRFKNKVVSKFKD